MQNLQTYQIEDSIYELDTYYNIGARSRMRVVGIIDVNSTIFFICEREDGEINLKISATQNFRTQNFTYYALQFHHLVQNNLVETQS
jgi:hypothetical protein